MKSEERQVGCTVVAEGVSNSDQLRDRGGTLAIRSARRRRRPHEFNVARDPLSHAPRVLSSAIMTTASYRSHIDLTAILAAQNPRIDLRLDEYERSTRSFMNLVANYTKRTTASVVEKTNAYNAEKSRLTEKIQITKTEINQCKEAEIELVDGELPPNAPSL